MDVKTHNFALIGVAGYIAVRHLQAIRETGNNLLATLDPVRQCRLHRQLISRRPIFLSNLKGLTATSTK
jgi:hypothetical protein